MAETEFKYDVFVSYSSVNKEWVRKTFVPILEKAGLKVCDYYRDFDPGAPIVKEMERAILESRKTILILSPAYLNSGWTEFENLMLQSLDAANQERRLLPVIYEKCDLPLRFRYMNCVNFDNPDDAEIEWQRLSRALAVTLSPSLLDPKPHAIGSREAWHLAHPYPMPPNFTGRAAELKMLDDWLADNENRLFILRALGGFGKSALAWQWINLHLNPTEWTKLVWWSFYEGDASFEHFVEETLKYLKFEVPQGQRPQVDTLLKAMQSQKILLIMDGFERALRAYSSMNAAYQGDKPKVEDSQLDCVNINAEIFLKNLCSLPNIKSKVLMTTRLTPRAVKPRGEFMLGCREVELTAMQKEDAVLFFHKQGIKGTHAEIEAACTPYGYHPLSLRLLAGRILKDFENPADIVVAQKLKFDGDVIQQKHHVLEISYDSLPKHEQKLLSTIACFRSLVEHKSLEAMAEDKDSLEKELHDLMDRGLLHFDEKHKKFDLHPIVRRYAYERLTAPDRTAAHTRLRDYFAAIDVPSKPQILDDLAPVMELYHHMVRAEHLDEARDLFRDRLANRLFFQMGAYQTIIELLGALFLDGEDKPPRLKDIFAQSWTLNSLGGAYYSSGQPSRVVPLMKTMLDLIKNDKKGLAVALDNMSSLQLDNGNLYIAESNLFHSVDLCKQIEDEHQEAIGHNYLGELLSYIGDWDKSELELDIAEKVFDKYGVGQTSYVSFIRANRVLRALLMIRDPVQSQINDHRFVIQLAQHALELAEEFAYRNYPIERDFVHAHGLLGASYRIDAQLDVAERHLSEALRRARVINYVRNEANILLDLARLRYIQEKYEEAKSLAKEALFITQRSGYVLQGADVNLFLAKYALEQEKDKARAKEYAQTALKLAYCDGPPYYYKVAYHEAEQLLERLKS